ncbi:MAG: hypothetical protein ACREFE_19490 [Limisphaerales bacterium]
MKTKLLVSILAGLFVAASASAMDRWSALSMLESGNNDRAIGPGGEISRFQILPELWPGGNPRDLQSALAAAKYIMQQRVEKFESIHKRAPTDFEFYVLWNAPAEMDHPSKTVSERAWRFANLVQS